MNNYGKYKGIIERITIADATFRSSIDRTVEPTVINFFYGNNGTGKSTIARALKSETGIFWNPLKSSGDFVIRIFSSDFVSNELKFNDDDPSMPGVLTVGEEFVDAQKLIEEKQSEIKNLTDQIESDTLRLFDLQQRKEVLKTRFLESCWEKAKIHKKIFGGGGDFRKKELCAERIMSTSPALHNLSDLQKRFVTATDPNAKKYFFLSLIDLAGLDKLESFSLLEEPIISAANSQFSRFMQSLDAAAWVKHGHEHYSPRASGKCPYCQHLLDVDFESRIKECFDGQYSEDCARIDTYQKQYEDYTLTLVAYIRQNIEFLKSLPQGFGSISEYEKTLALIENVVAANSRLIAEKIARPSESFKTGSLHQYLETTNRLIAETNVLIANHNKIIDDQRQEQSACLAGIWELLSHELKTVVMQYHADNKDLNNKLAAQSAQIGSHKNCLAAARADVEKLTFKLGGSAATIQKINSVLKRTGFHGFSLSAHNAFPDRYIVVRDDGSPAKRLSEGERNFIAFLYFYCLVLGSWKQDDLLKNKIVVIDDPVSSMDNSVLTIVGELVRQLINDCFLDGEKHQIKQIFVLTHNPYFHKSVSQEMLRPEEAFFKKVSFFEIKKCDDNVSRISKPCIQKSCSNDPDIEYENASNIPDAYSEMWQDYKNTKNPTALKHIINRIIDYHFFQICNYVRDDLISRVADFIGADASKLHRINDILHLNYEQYEFDENVGSEIYCPRASSVNDYKDALRTVFEAMGQTAHYAKMSGEI